MKSVSGFVILVYFIKSWFDAAELLRLQEMQYQKGTS